MQTILVVDDDIHQKELYLELFQQHGFQAIAAGDGEAAWKLIEQQLPDLIFTGIIMPRLDGFGLIERLRANPRTRNIPVIMFSHRGRPEDKQRAGTYPRVDFKIKGYDSPAEILNTVQALLAAETGPAATARKPKPVEVAEEDDDRPGRQVI